MTSLATHFDAARAPQSPNARRILPGLMAGLLVGAIGLADYWTGVRITLSLVYLVPIAIGAWYVGRGFAVVLCGASVVVWLVTDAANGQVVLTGVYAWNGLITFTVYAFVALLLTRLHELQTELEARAKERAKALTGAIGDRARLERELLQISEREQRRIGQDLHDTLCQHLTATALAGEVLAEKLAARAGGGVAEARQIVRLLEDGIAMCRRLAKGLHPVEPRADGLMVALEELSVMTNRLHAVACQFQCDGPALIHAPEVATHLFRIAQESVGNAVRHGRAKTIVIALEAQDCGLVLSVEDDGVGLAEGKGRASGMGLRIMEDRARVMGATLEIARASGGGVIVRCLLPRDDGHDGPGDG